MNVAAKLVKKALTDYRISLNVGGVIFETMSSTLQKFPGTRLATLAVMHEKDESWDGEKKQFFFDRHPGVFSFIIHFYRTEELHIEHNICGNIIKGELEFWGLTELDIEPCCWGQYSRYKENKDTLAALDDNFTASIDNEAWGEKPSSFNKFKLKMWTFLEDPNSSRAAKLYAVLSMFFVLLSIGIFCLETHPWFRVKRPGAILPNISALQTARIIGDNSCFCECRINKDIPYNMSDPHDVMRYLDYLCAAFFTVEYMVRLYFAPKKLVFIRTFMNIIDILCLLPHFISIIIKTVNPDDTTSQIFKSVVALRIVRILRIFKLMKHYTAFKILVYTIKVSTKELLLLVIFLFTGVLIFASLIFYAENSTFPNIPVGFWWALVTMTTVGYGDKVPRTEGGYLIGSLCVLCGVLTVAFTVPIVVNNFTLYYSHAQSRVRLPEKKRKELQKRIMKKNQKASEFIHKLAMNVQQKKTTNEPFNGVPGLKTPRDLAEDNPHPKHSVASQYKQTQPVKRSSKWGGLAQGGARIITVSEHVPELSPTSPPKDLPGTPISIELEPKSLQHIETEQLLNDLHGANEKLKEERQRQLDLIKVRREEKRQAKLSPRPSPAPAASAKPQQGQ